MHFTELIAAISSHPYTQAFTVIFATLVNSLIALPSFRQLYQASGLQRTLYVITALSAFAYLFEGQALITSWPYGSFHYTAAVGPLLFEFIPVLLPLSWVPLALGSFAIGNHTTKLLLETRQLSTHVRSILVVVLGTITLVATDLVLDPVAAKLGFWVWQDTTGFYGVPWSNFVGWAVSGAIAVAFLQMFFTYQTTQITVQLATSLRIFLVFWSVLAVATQLWTVASIGATLSVLLHWLSKQRTAAVSQS